MPKPWRQEINGTWVRAYDVTLERVRRFSGETYVERDLVRDATYLGLHDLLEDGRVFVYAQPDSYVATYRKLDDAIKRHELHPDTLRFFYGDDRIVVRRPDCSHCGEPPSRHITKGGKCLFASTHYSDAF